MKALSLLLCAALTAPALGQTTSLQSSNPAPRSGKDPNRKICEKVERIGSRVAVDRVCMTAREWDDLRRFHRNDVEKVQQLVNQKHTD